MSRLMLSDELWSKLRTIMRQQGIYDKPDLRLMVEAMLYRMRVGCPWQIQHGAIYTKKYVLDLSISWIPRTSPESSTRNLNVS